LICIGVYSVNNSSFDVGLVILFGVLGYLLKLLEFEPAPMLIGFILGPMMEQNFRRAMVLTQGEYMELLTRPVTAIFLFGTLALLTWMVISGLPSVMRKLTKTNKKSESS
jgi:TctA family transporter